MNENNLLVKDNVLVSKAIYNIKYLEQLIFLSALSEIESRSKINSSEEYIIDLPKLAKIANLQSDYYKEIKRAAENLYSRKISIPQKDGSIIVTGFIHAYKYHDGEAKLSVYFSPKIIPYISHIKNSFVCYKFKQIAKFRSSYAIRIYELLIQKIDISNIRIIEISEIKNLFKLGKSYDRYNNLIQRVISPALQDINKHSDINVIYKEIRTGRKITALEFHIEALEPRPKTKKQLAQEALPGETYKDVKERLKEEKEPKKAPFWKNLFKSI